MRKPVSLFIICFLLVGTISCLLAGCQQKRSTEFISWNIYRGDEGSNAYSQLDQINTENVKQLKVAWIFQSGDKTDFNSLECSPIIVNAILYGVPPRLKTFALDAKTGKKLWIFNPFPENSKDGGVSRGITYWSNGKDERIFIVFEGALCCSRSIIFLRQQQNKFLHVLLNMINLIGLNRHEK